MVYTERIFEKITKENPNESEFRQAVIETLSPVAQIIDGKKIYEEMSILERIIEPDRQIKFRVSWRDDSGKIQVNRGYRVQFNNAIGPYKGGLRFHPSVNISVIKFLGFEQIFKNALTGLPIGGAKGGSDFDPKGKSDFETMAFCQSFMTELYRYIGAHTDIPAGDIGVGAREIGYLFGQYKRLKNIHEGVFTGKGLEFDGLPGRKEATGYGLIYFAEEMLTANDSSLEDKTICISGAGNVAIYAAEKAIQFGAKVVTMSDSSGWIYDGDGIDLEIIKEIKEVRKGRISEYTTFKKSAKYFCGRFNWIIPCDVALPCATQNEILIMDAKNLANGGCNAVVEGANMPTDLEATKFLVANGVLFGPAKAANAGGVATSEFEMSQNASKTRWEFAETDVKLRKIMKTIFTASAETAKEYGQPKNYILGANIRAFITVSDAIIAQGVC